MAEATAEATAEAAKAAIQAASDEGTTNVLIWHIYFLLIQKYSLST
ncbi:hypothetical protein [Paenibacillus maysiensis]|nr:hypothetical protein [Paenibacillus maysiensis]